MNLQQGREEIIVAGSKLGYLIYSFIFTSPNGNKTTKYL